MKKCKNKLELAYSHVVSNGGIYLMFLSATVSLAAGIDFIIHQMKIGCNCFLFGEIFEVKRVFVSGPITVCWFYILTMWAIVAVGYWIVIVGFCPPHYHYM